MAIQSASPQIHQKKSEIIEHVARRERLVEFDRVEQHWPVFDQDDIAQVKIAVAAADLTLIFTLGKQRFSARESAFHCPAKAVDSSRREGFGCRFEGNERLLDLRRQRRARIRSNGNRRAPVRRGNSARKLCDDVKMEFVSPGQAIERAAFIETPHMHGPFDDRAAAPKLNYRTVLRNRNGAEVEIRSIGPIDRKLALAGSLPLVEGRI